MEAKDSASRRREARRESTIAETPLPPPSSITPSAPTPSTVSTATTSSLPTATSDSSIDSTFSSLYADSEDVQQDLFDAVRDEDHAALTHILSTATPSTVLQALLTFQHPNTPTSAAPHFAHDPEVLQDAQELLGPDVTDLNILQCACLLGEEDLATEILNYVDVHTEKMGTRKVLYELLGRVWGGGNTTLHLASFQGMPGLVRVLIGLGSNLNKRNDRSYRPVDCADDDSTRALFLNVTDVIQSPRSNFGTDSRSGVQSSKHDSVDGPQHPATPQKPLSIDNPIDGATADSGSSDPTLHIPSPSSPTTPTHDPKRRERKSSKRRRVTFDARTLLAEAAHVGDLVLLRSILDDAETDPGTANENVAVAPLHQTFLEQTPLHIAAGNDHLDCCEFLISRGARVNAVDAEGWTPLHCAAYEGHEAVVRYFCGLDVTDLEILNDEGESVADAAKDHPRVRTILLETSAVRISRRAALSETSSRNSADVTVDELRKAMMTAPPSSTFPSSEPAVLEPIDGIKAMLGNEDRERAKVAPDYSVPMGLATETKSAGEDIPKDPPKLRRRSSVDPASPSLPLTPTPPETAPSDAAFPTQEMPHIPPQPTSSHASSDSSSPATNLALSPTPRSSSRVTPFTIPIPPTSPDDLRRYEDTLIPTSPNRRSLSRRGTLVKRTSDGVYADVGSQASSTKSQRRSPTKSNLPFSSSVDSVVLSSVATSRPPPLGNSPTMHRPPSSLSSSPSLSTSSTSSSSTSASMPKNASSSLPPPPPIPPHAPPSTSPITSSPSSTSSRKLTSATTTTTSPRTNKLGFEAVSPRSSKTTNDASSSPSSSSNYTSRSASFKSLRERFNAPILSLAASGFAASRVPRSGSVDGSGIGIGIGNGSAVGVGVGVGGETGRNSSAMNGMVGSMGSSPVGSTMSLRKIFTR